MDGKPVAEDYEIQPFNDGGGKDGKFYKGLLFLGVAVFLGLVSGWGAVFYRHSQGRQFLANEGRGKAKTNLEKGKIYGDVDGKTFKDTAIGVIENNKDANGGKEGTHRLLREGGESQTVYLTSSVLDLNKFVGVKVKIWGETFSSDKVGWLMDVGKIKVLE